MKRFVLGLILSSLLGTSISAVEQALPRISAQQDNVATEDNQAKNRKLSPTLQWIKDHRSQIACGTVFGVVAFYALALHSVNHMFDGMFDGLNNLKL
jgi:hypothetical protein